MALKCLKQVTRIFQAGIEAIQQANGAQQLSLVYQIVKSRK